MTGRIHPRRLLLSLLPLSRLQRDHEGDEVGLDRGWDGSELGANGLRSGCASGG